MRYKWMITFVLTVTSLPLFAAAPNLLKGGSFDNPEAVTNWSTQFTRISEVNATEPGWIGVDALGSPASGSMVLTGAGMIMQCAPVTAGTSYDFGARILITTRAGFNTPLAYVRLNFFAAEQCVSTPLGEAFTDAAAALPGRFTSIAGQAQVAPQGALSALVTVFVTTGGVLSPPGALKPAVYVDDTFLQERGGCAPDKHSLCLAGGTLRATVHYFGEQGGLSAPAQQTSTSTGYFYGDSADAPELTIKAIDLSEAGWGKWIVVGGLTNLRLQITVEDVTRHERRTYTNVSGHFLEQIVDVFSAP